LKIARNFSRAAETGKRARNSREKNAKLARNFRETSAKKARKTALERNNYNDIKKIYNDKNFAFAAPNPGGKKAGKSGK
jgi:hypothetical protein